MPSRSSRTGTNVAIMPLPAAVNAVATITLATERYGPIDCTPAAAQRGYTRSGTRQVFADMAACSRIPAISRSMCWTWLPRQ